MTRKRESKEAEPRRRRSAEEARRVILDAAEKRLAEGGPEAVRLQEIARDVGVSHPAILHHFGSRDGLTQALAQRAIERLDQGLLAAIETAGSGGGTLAMIEQIFATLGDSGQARLFAWRALQWSGEPNEHDEQHMFRNVTDAVHRLRVQHARERGEAEPSREDSFFVVRLAATALLGDAVGGDLIDLSISMQDTRPRFRSWLVRLLADHVGLGPEEPPR